MDYTQLVGMAYDALKARKLRAALTILMVVMGASLIVALNGTGNGFSSFVDSQFSQLGANVLVVQPRGGAFKMDRSFIDVLSGFTGVKEIIPYVQQTSAVSSKGETQTTITVGMDQSKLPLLFPTISVDLGDYVASTDNIGMLLGSEIAKTAIPSETFVSIGQPVVLAYQKYDRGQITIARKSFTVRGTLSSVGTNIVPVDQMVFISLSAANSLFERDNNYDGVYVITESPQLNRAVQGSIRRKYSGETNIVSPQAIADTIDNVKSAVYLFIYIIASVSLMVASVGIVTTLHTSMMERIREIGLLKALGFNNRLVLTTFLNEALIIGFVGGSIGLVFGMGLSYVMSYFVAMNIDVGVTVQIIPWFEPGDLLFTWVLCVSLSTISGFYPAWRASRLDPVVALRHE